ncbi:MAG: FRG domain-containing protein [Candidatus Omnitrophica bacterium]|nr:FRG domain-containing protein [Candidatus Omnitrophota bacterium]MBU1924929.1 FRG domain-containing protein [Candidatus Omnitrophota bacterium]
MKHEDFATIKKCDSWQELCEKHDNFCLKKGKIWVFRGQKNAAWDLKTTFERLTDIVTDIVKRKNIPSFEFGLLRKFKREFSLYSKRIAKDDDLIEWFSLMQHYGTPTRLLDWTYSFYVATFFALEDIENENESAIWAIETKWLEHKLFKKCSSCKKLLRRDLNLQKKESLKTIINKLVVAKVNPYYVHERLSVQQGCFLFPGDTTQSFLDNLLGLAGTKKELKNNLIKFVVTEKKTEKRAILEDLFRMNITRTSLFPGIDGYAASLKVAAFILPETLKPGTEYREFIKGVVRKS